MGKKPGRRGWKEELKMKEIAQLSQGIIKRALTSDEISFERKIRIAEQLYVKFIPRDINLGNQDDRPLKLTWVVNGEEIQLTPESGESVHRQK